MASTYPDLPGFKGTDGTSEAAATAIALTVPRLRLIALRGLAARREATPLEVVAATGLAREALQPRFSELRAVGLVEPTGERRRNPSGKWAAVLRPTAKGWEALA